MTLSSAIEIENTLSQSPSSFSIYSPRSSSSSSSPSSPSPKLGATSSKDLADSYSSNTNSAKSKIATAMSTKGLKTLRNGNKNKSAIDGKRSTYKHVPHCLKPAHLVAKRNARERTRVQAVNSAFGKLRKHVPYEAKHKRLSKVKTLRLAIDYIQHLQTILQDHDKRTAGLSFAHSELESAVENPASSRARRRAKISDARFPPLPHPSIASTTTYCIKPTNLDSYGRSAAQGYHVTNIPQLSEPIGLKMNEPGSSNLSPSDSCPVVPITSSTRLPSRKNSLYSETQLLGGRYPSSYSSPEQRYSESFFDQNNFTSCNLHKSYTESPQESNYPQKNSGILRDHVNSRLPSALEGHVYQDIIDITLHKSQNTSGVCQTPFACHQSGDDFSRYADTNRDSLAVRSQENRAWPPDFSGEEIYYHNPNHPNLNSNLSRSDIGRNVMTYTSLSNDMPFSEFPDY
ncbi:achaete-scute-like protein [Plakobranchus ocellatus]|uniref:Achaete-scute-like protein n=1 Tax=Plakobranchus ocellatus TaxID=259542 RepID=A0AAV3ZGG8_9GAST|nr:achaete-scute-like protein [Plakobranchus ocellatus]